MTNVHEFEPIEEEREEDVFIRARCSCGWEGSSHPQADGGYDDALAEHARHLEGDPMVESGP